MVEYLYDLLPLHHFLDVAVLFSEVGLLGNKVLSAFAREGFRHKHHYPYHNESKQSERNAEREHTRKHRDDRYSAVENLSHALADHLAQGIDVVCVNAHNIAVGVSVKILYRQAFHVTENVISQITHRALSDVYHYSRLSVCRRRAYQVKHRDARYRNK